ncbi:MAG: 4a-hydroxytetrahydrobiopterin dehydratase [Planctomycetota bacterium]
MSEERTRTHGEDEIRARLARDLPHWTYDGAFLCRRYRTGGWRATTMAFGAVAHLAELAWHHPDVEASYGSLTVKLQTHDAGGITDLDFALAARIEDVVAWSPGEGPLPGLPDGDAHAYVLGEGDGR